MSSARDTAPGPPLWRPIDAAQEGFTAVSIVALALGIGVNTAVFTAYKAFIVRPLDARDPATLVNLSFRLQSGATSARFSYPDYEAYRDGLQSLSGVIAFSIDELKFTGVGQNMRPARAQEIAVRQARAVASGHEQRRARKHLHRFGELLLGARRGASAWPHVRGGDRFGARRLAVDPYQRELLAAALRRRSDGAGQEHSSEWRRLHHRRHYAGYFVGTSVAVPNFWLPLDLYPAGASWQHRLRDRDALCCRVFGRLAPGVSMGEAQAETSLLASRLRTLHNPQSDLGKM